MGDVRAQGSRGAYGTGPRPAEREVGQPCFQVPGTVAVRGRRVRRQGLTGTDREIPSGLHGQREVAGARGRRDTVLFSLP